MTGEATKAASEAWKNTHPCGVGIMLTLIVCVASIGRIDKGGAVAPPSLRLLNGSPGLPTDSEVVRERTQLPFLIFQSSLPHTGSTLMTNILIGLFDRVDTPHCYMENFGTHDPCPANVVIKTHNKDIDEMERWGYAMGAREVYFVSTIRYGETFGKGSCGDFTNVLCLDYEDFTYSNRRDMPRTVHKVARATKQRFAPLEGYALNESAAIERLAEMEKVTKQLKDEPFSHWSPIFGIHGSHRNRIPNSNR